MRVWFSLGVVIHIGMYFQQLPDYTVHIGTEAGRPTGRGGEGALGGKKIFRVPRVLEAE